ncbi:MAG: hypothetical protein ACHQ4H_18910, partial [Ktedonobacterales bacterium]
MSATLVAFALTLFVAGEMATFTQLRVVCMRTCAAEQVSASQLQTLLRLGVSLDAYAAFVSAVTLLIALVWFGSAAVVFWRRSDSLFLLLLATQLVTQGAEYGAGGLFSAAWQRPVILLTTLNSIMFCLFLALFPTGRFAPRWMVWVVMPVSVALAVAALPLPKASADLINDVLFPMVLVVLIVAQVYRYRTVSNRIQRQQTKWVILGIGVSLLVELGISILEPLIPGLSAPGALFPLLSVLIVDLALVLGPIAFVIAILRYRLYDIDLLINRALVYGSLTALLAAVYFGCVIGAQALAQALTGIASLPPVAIVASTLLIAALFTPLRRGIQRFIDRRF